MKKRAKVLSGMGQRWPLWLMGVGGVLACVLGTALWASYRLPPPVVVLDGASSGLRPVNYSMIQALGDHLRGRKYLLITFDDGPAGPPVDEKIIDILNRHHAAALFFFVCENLGKARADLFTQLRAAGHLIGNHSFDHAHISHLSGSALAREVGGCSTTLARLTGQWPGYFRPPFGERSTLLSAEIHAAGMAEMLWNANSEDSWLLAPDQILDWSDRQSENFSILLLHSKPTTAAVLDRVLSRLERRGFVFVIPVNAAVNTKVS